MHKQTRNVAGTSRGFGVFITHHLYYTSDMYSYHKTVCTELVPLAAKSCLGKLHMLHPLYIQLDHNMLRNYKTQRTKTDK